MESPLGKHGKILEAVGWLGDERGFQLGYLLRGCIGSFL